MQQAINVARRLGRKVVFVGRSIDRKAAIAKNLGYMHYPDDLVVPLRKVAKNPNQKYVYIISGSYGQPGSALYRLTLGEHEYLKIYKGDVVVFSADPAPAGSKTNVDFIVDKLIEADVDVHYYDLQEDLHVSGHGSIKDIEMLFALTQPKYYIPIGGTMRHMRAYGLIAQGMGAQPQNVLELNPGEVVEFKEGLGKVTGKIPVKNILVDGLGIGDVGSVVLRDRQILAKDGIAIALIQFDGNEGKLISDPEVISRGFVYEGKNKRFLEQAGAMLGKNLQRKNKLDANLIRNETVDFLERLFYQQIGRRPMILPVVIEV